MKPKRMVLAFAVYIAAVLLLVWLFESDLVFWTGIALAALALAYGLWRMLGPSPLQHNLHRLEMLRAQGQVAPDDYVRMRQALLDGRPASEVFASMRNPPER